MFLSGILLTEIEDIEGILPGGCIEEPTNSIADQFISAITGVMTATWGIIFLISVFYILCLWLAFRKAGKGGWESIIPIYNIWMMAELGTGKGYFSLLILIPIIGVFGAYYLMYKFFKAYRMSTGLAIISLIFPFIGFFLAAFSSKYSYKGYWRGV